MKKCQDCANWGTENHWMRTCKALHISGSSIYRGPCTGKVLAKTPETFSCGEFTEKPKGPFIIGDNLVKGYWIYYEPTDLTVGAASTLERAKRVCEELNAEWKRRE